MRPDTQLIPDDVEILRAGAVFVEDKNELDYLWYALREEVGGTPEQRDEAGRLRKAARLGKVYEHYKVVRLFQLRGLPVETRRDSAVLQRMQEVLWGLYKVSARIDFIHLAAGIFKPSAVGIVQMYGVSCMDGDLEEAAANSALGFEALRSNLRGVFPQIRLRALDAEMVTWINQAFVNFRYATSTVGHPDPREEDSEHTSKNSKSQTAGKQRSKSSLSEHQNEKFFRAMAAGNHEFLWTIIATPVPEAEIGRMLVSTLDDASAWKSKQEGVKAISLNMALPMMLSQGVMHSAQTGYAQAFAKSHQIGVGEQLASSHMVGSADSRGTAHSTMASHSIGVADGTNWGHATSVSTTDVTGTSHGHGVQDAVGHAHTTSHSVTNSSGESTSTGSSSGGGSSSTTNWGTTNSNGASANAGVDLGVNLGGSVNTSQANTLGGSYTVSGFGSTSFGQTVSSGTAVTDGWADTSSQSHGVSQDWGTSASHSISHGVTDSIGGSHQNSEGWSTGVSDTVSQSHTDSVSDGISKGISRQAADGVSQGITGSRGLGLGQTLGGSFGIVPSMGVSRSHKVYDETARIIAEMLASEAMLLQRANKAGGWMVDVYTFAESAQAIGVVEAATGQAFGGTEETVTRIQTRYLTGQEQDHLRLHASCFTPSTMREVIPGVVEAYRHTTLMDPLMAATLVSPASMQLGDANVVQERIPDFAFYPNMNKSVAGHKSVVGEQISTETAELTTAAVVLAEELHTHTIFQGDARSGKSEAAYRMALSTWTWGNRVIVLDFAKGWNRFFNSPVPKKYFELYQLQAAAPRPIRWPVLAVPTLIDAERYVTMVCENIAKSGRLGQVQIGLLQTSLRELYVKYGVLLLEEEVIRSSRWGTVSEAEAARLSATLGVTAGMSLAALSGDAAQALAVLRSHKVGLREWVDGLEKKKEEKGTTERERQALAAVLFRLRELTVGQAGKMFGTLAEDENAVLIEQLGLLGDRPGFVVIEGGDELGEFQRSFLLGLLACILYSSAKIQYALAGGRVPYATEIFWEEANKVLVGPEANSSSSDSGGTQQATPEAFVEMWRDGERYKFRNHPIVQSLSQLPQGIVPSCNNGFFFRSKDTNDQKIILTYLARSPSGFVDQDYQRFLARMPKTYCIARFGMSLDIMDMEPFLMRALQVPMYAPSNDDLREYYTAQDALRSLQKDGLI